MKWFALAVLAVAACSDGQRVHKKFHDEPCGRNLDCAYGLECVERAAGADGGVIEGKSCQYHSFADCDGDGSAPTPGGRPQCLSGQKCRDGHCTVMCASKTECKEGEACKVGICQKSGGGMAQCYDNRDCAWPMTCYYGQCVTRTETLHCMSDLDCGYGWRCVNGTCQ